MKRFIQMTVLVLILAAAIPGAGATEKKCTGDAAHAKPPVPNYPSHIRNVVWRNQQALCQAQISTAGSSQIKSSNLDAVPLGSVQTQTQLQKQ